MATISFSDSAPTDAGTVHFSFGGASFDLEPGRSVEIDDKDTVSAASAHPWLKVEVESSSDAPSAEQVAAEVANSTDPHVNPAADHLSAAASPEAVEAAKAAAPEPVQASPEPVVSEPVPAEVPVGATSIEGASE